MKYFILILKFLTLISCSKNEQIKNKFVKKEIKGDEIFKSNCKACHIMGQDLIGPDLTGVTKKRDKEWLKKFISNSQGLIESGDKEAIKIWEEYNRMPMQSFSFTEEEFEHLYDYLKKN